jgi:lambda repressor-like predicted transcriptional regulator
MKDVSNVFIIAKELRAVGFSMAALARWIGISENSVYKWMERGVVPEARREAVVLAAWLGSSPLSKRALDRVQSVRYA